jgi:hypothetical protein
MDTIIGMRAGKEQQARVEKLKFKIPDLDHKIFTPIDARLFTNLVKKRYFTKTYMIFPTFQLESIQLMVYVSALCSIISMLEKSSSFGIGVAQ